MKPKRLTNFAFRILSIVFILMMVVGQGAPATLVQAAAAPASLTIAPITWNVVGLDSNNVNTGPNDFPVGVRVTNPTGSSISGLTVTFAWTSGDAASYIQLQPGTSDAYNGVSLAAGAYQDFYFTIQITRTPLAYNTTRRYVVSVTDASHNVLASTPPFREIYVEHLISQNRNSVNGIYLDGQLVGSAGMTLMLGNTYTLELDGSTATNGYNQIEDFINLPNNIFRVNSVKTTYSAPPGATSTTLYGDACGWDNNLLDPTYRSCIGSDDKLGGKNIVTTFNITIIGGLGSSITLNSLIYDFSGSSYHYNSDFSSSAAITSISDALKITKTFNPDLLTTGTDSILTVTLQNLTTGPVDNVNFNDPLPAGMSFTSGGSPALTGCGSGVAALNGSTLQVSGVDIAASSTCSIAVPVTVTSDGTYTNTTGHLMIGNVDTGLTASANLIKATPGGGTVVCGLTLAQWTFEQSGISPTSPAPSSGTGSATYGGITVSIGANGHPGNAWVGNNFTTGTGLTTFYQFNVDMTNYSQIGMSFDIERGGNQAPQTIGVAYSMDGTTYTPLSTTTITDTTYHTISILSSSTPYIPTGAKYFRIYGSNAGNTGNDAALYLDNVTFSGCTRPANPTLAKAFSPATIAKGTTSTLTFTLTNPNNINLTEAAFTDALPTGVKVATPPNASNTCNGTFNPSAGDTNLTFSGGTIPANSSCTARIDVTAALPGVYLNVTGYISTRESGINTGAGGSASATLTVLDTPGFIKHFSPNPIYAGQTSTLTFTLTNPNAVALAGAAFTDTLPAGMQVASTPNASSTCGGTFAPIAGATALSFSGGTIPANGQCTIQVDVTASSIGTYVNTSSSLTTGVPCLTAPPAIDTLTVIIHHPGINLLKQVSASAAGPWTNFILVAPGAPVYYRLNVENVGDVDLTNVVVSDPTVALSTCSPALPTSLAAGVDATCVIGPLTAQTGDVLNTATAQGDYNGTTYTSSSTAEYLGVPIVPAASLALIKQVGLSPTGPWALSLTGVAPGGNVYYKFTMVNNGNQALSNLSINDPNVSTSSCEFINPLNPGSASVCVVGPITALAGTHQNTATAAGDYSGTQVTSPPASAIYTCGTFAISGVVWVDLNQDGIIQGGEPGLSGVLLSLYQDNNGTKGALLGTQTTDASGAYSFSNLAPGSYFVEVTGGVSGYTLVSGGSNPRPVVISNANSTNNNFGYLSQAKLTVSKTDNVNHAVTAGSSAVTYTIVVSNAGPGAADGTLVKDPAVAGIDVTGVTCGSVSGGAACPSLTPPGVTDLQGGIAIPTLPAGGSVTFTVTATITVTGGSVVNTVTLTPPQGLLTTSDSVLTSSDTVGVGQVADLSITKDDGVTSVAPNTSVSYAIVVSNAGPSAADGAVLKDPPVAGIDVTGVSCGSESGNATCPTTANGVADLQGAGIVIPKLPAGGSVTFTVTAKITATSGNVTNTASVTPPPGVTNTNPVTTASDTDSLSVTPQIYHLYLPLVSTVAIYNWHAAVDYEDMSMLTGQADYDYNDWAVNINGTLTYAGGTNGMVQAIGMAITPLARGATYDHEFSIHFPAQTFASSGTAVLTIFDAQHNVLSTQTIALDNSKDNTIVIFPKTSEVFPGSVVDTVEGQPYEAPQRFANLSIAFNTPFLFTWTLNPGAAPHGQGLFFDPVLHVWNTGQDIHVGDLRLLEIPTTNWQWPEEGVRIDKAYPLVTFTPGLPPTINFPPNWWTVHNHCVYDGVTCVLP